MRTILMLLALTSCADDPDVVPLVVDFYGEPCVDDPPAATLCHGDRGWCVVDVCRPQCGPGPDRCPAGEEHWADSGACYCEP